MTTALNENVHRGATLGRVRASAFGAETALRAQTSRLGYWFRKLQRVDVEASCGVQECGSALQARFSAQGVVTVQENGFLTCLAKENHEGRDQLGVGEVADDSGRSLSAYFGASSRDARADQLGGWWIGRETRCSVVSRRLGCWRVGFEVHAVALATARGGPMPRGSSHVRREVLRTTWLVRRWVLEHVGTRGGLHWFQPM